MRHLAARGWVWARRGLAAVGLMTVVTVGWLLAGLPLGIDRGLNVVGVPAPADAIVCIGGGTTTGMLPTSEGWHRLYTTAQLHADRLAPLVVFTGRGNARVSEAEVYSDAARWLGVPPEVTHLDPLPSSTAEHPATLLKSLEGQITRESRLLLVTSKLHSRRVLLTFRKHGFTNVTVVSDYKATMVPPATGKEPAVAEGGRREVSTLPAFQRDSKRYDDPMFILTHRSAVLFTSLREWAAITVYRLRGQL